MRRHFVQQDYRIRLVFDTGKSRGLGQNQIENQGFLLAGGALGGGAVAAPVNDLQIAPMRAGERASGGGVSLSRVGEIGAERTFLGRCALA